FLPFRQTLDLHPFRRFPARHLLVLIRSKLERAHRYAEFILKNAAHPQRHRIEMRAHSYSLSGKIFRRPNAARLVYKHIAVTKLSVRKNRNRPDWRDTAVA